jgi:hypothetical protein
VSARWRPHGSAPRTAFGLRGMQMNGEQIARWRE